MFGLLDHDNLAQASLWHPPDLCGVMEKQGRRSGEWNARYFILKGSNLFWFSRPSSRKPRGHVPLEGATVHAVRPPAISVYTQHMHEDERTAMPALFGMVLVLDDVFASSPGGRPELVLAVGSAELQALWTKALQQAAIPRPQLLAKLQESAKMVDMLGELQANQEPYMDGDTIPAVMDTRGRATSSSPHTSRQNVRFSSPQAPASRSVSASPRRPASDSGAAGDGFELDEYGNPYEQTRNSVLTSTGSHAVPLPAYVPEDEQEEVARQLGPPFAAPGPGSYMGSHGSPRSIYAGSRSAIRGLERQKSPLRVRAERILKGLKDILTGAGRPQHHHHYYLAGGQVPSPQMVESMTASDPYAVLEHQVAEQQMMESLGVPYVGGGSLTEGHWGSPGSPSARYASPPRGLAHSPASFYSETGGRVARAQPPAANTGSVGGALVHNIISDWAVDGEVDQGDMDHLRGPARSMQSASSSTWRPALASNGNSSPHGYIPRSTLPSSGGRSVPTGSLRSRTRSAPHGSAQSNVRTETNPSGGSNVSVDLPTGVDGAWLLSAFQQMQASLNQVASTLQNISSTPASPSGIVPPAQQPTNAVAVDSLSAVRQQLQACLAALQGQEQPMDEMPLPVGSPFPRTGSRSSHSAGGTADMMLHPGPARDTVSFSGFATPSNNSPIASAEASPAFPRASSPSVISGVRMGSQSVMQAVQQALPRHSDIALVVGPSGSMGPVDIQHSGMLSDSQQLHMDHMDGLAYGSRGTPSSSAQGAVPLPTFSVESLMAPRDECARVRESVALSMHELQARLTALNSSLAEREARASAESNDLEGVVGASVHSDRSGSYSSPRAYGNQDICDAGYTTSSAIQNAVVGLPSRLSVMSARDAAGRSSGMYMGQQADLPFHSDVQEAPEPAHFSGFLPEDGTSRQSMLMTDNQGAARQSMNQSARPSMGARSSYVGSTSPDVRASFASTPYQEQRPSGTAAYEQFQPLPAYDAADSYEHVEPEHSAPAVYAQQHRATAPPSHLQQVQRPSYAAPPMQQLPRKSAPPTILQQYGARTSMSPPPRSASISIQQQARLSALGLVGDSGAMDQLVLGQGPLSNIGQRTSSGQFSSPSQEYSEYSAAQEGVQDNGVYWDGEQQFAARPSSAQRMSQMQQQYPQETQLHDREYEQQARASSQTRMSQQWQEGSVTNRSSYATSSPGSRMSGMSNMQSAQQAYGNSRSASPSRARHSMLAQQEQFQQYGGSRSASPSRVRPSMLAQQQEGDFQEQHGSSRSASPPRMRGMSSMQAGQQTYEDGSRPASLSTAMSGGSVAMRNSQFSSNEQRVSYAQAPTRYSMASQPSDQSEPAFMQQERVSQYSQGQGWSQQPSARASQLSQRGSSVMEQQSGRTSQRSQQGSWQQQSGQDYDGSWQENARSSHLVQAGPSYDGVSHSSLQEGLDQSMRPSFSRGGSQYREPSFAERPLETIPLIDSSEEWVQDPRQVTRVTRTGSHSVAHTAASGYGKQSGVMSSSNIGGQHDWQEGAEVVLPELNPTRQSALSSAKGMQQAARSTSSSPSAAMARQWGSDTDGVAVVDTAAAAFSNKPNVRIPSALVPLSELPQSGQPSRPSFQTRLSASTSQPTQGEGLFSLPSTQFNIRPSVVSSQASAAPGHTLQGMEMSELEHVQEQPALARRARYSSTDWC